LSEAGFIEGKNVVIEYRWADGDYDRLPALAADFVGRKVDVIATSGGDRSAVAAKTATSTIPIVSVIGGDPLAAGLIVSLARPGGNLTGVSFLTGELMPKRLEILHDLVPSVATIAVLVNPKTRGYAELTMAVKEAAAKIRLQLSVLKASTEDEIDIGFASLSQTHAGALIVQADPFFTAQREQLVALTSSHAIPAIYEWRGFVVAGGLISYGASITGVYREVGSYAGRILNGAKPADLPVQQPTTFELVVNLTTAKALGLTVPPSILARADEVIE
jgi:putative ABC transport system substrate-binding protein